MYRYLLTFFLNTFRHWSFIDSNSDLLLEKWIGEDKKRYVRTGAPKRTQQECKYRSQMHALVLHLRFLPRNFLLSSSKNTFDWLFINKTSFLRYWYLSGSHTFLLSLLFSPQSPPSKICRRTLKKLPVTYCNAWGKSVRCSLLFVFQEWKKLHEMYIFSFATKW